VVSFKKIFFLILFFTISVFGVTEHKVLSPEEAFKIDAIKSGDVLSISVNLGEKIYLYDEQLKLSITKPIEVSLDNEITRPTPIQYDEFLVHKKSFKLLVPMATIKKYVSSGAYTITLFYQGCSQQGICYQPLQKSFEFTLEGTTQNDPVKPSSLSEQDAIAYTIATSSITLVLLTFFGFGLLLSLTPCVFPMIPILSSIIVSQSDNMSTKKAFWLSLVYVLAMALAYTLAGILAGLFGANLQASLQNPWVISVFSLVFVALAFSMFGFYKIQLPSFIQSALTKKSDQMQGHGLLSVAVMGFLSALIVGPCVAAPLAGALIYIGQTGDAFLGGMALFVMSLGMGVPLIIIGMSAGKFMPRPGEWMENVNAIFGVIMLGVALWMLSRIVSMQIIMFLSSFIVIGSAVYMGALEQLEKPARGVSKLIKSIGVILFLYGILLFVGALTNANNFLNPLEKIGSSSISAVKDEHPDFKVVRTLDALTSITKSSSKPIMIDFYADWCVSCIELDKFTFSNKKVQEKLENFTLLRIDVTQNSEEDKKLLKEFGLFGPPAIIFYKENIELKEKRVIGFKNAEEFLNLLESI
jgi:thiol:disulfide interchange protein DsbD